MPPFSASRKRVRERFRGREKNSLSITRAKSREKKSRGSLAMKFPKTTNRYCPYCKKKTEQKIKLVGTGFQRGTMTRGSISRAKKRGLGRGYGNKGKWGSKPAMSKFKRKSKTTKKTNIMYTCSVCKKSKYQKRGQRAGKQVQE